jgi:hypothetical protein
VIKGQSIKEWIIIKILCNLDCPQRVNIVVVEVDIFNVRQ